MEFKPKCITTGIGSLPYKNSKEALDLILKYLPDLPFWPQLPQRDFKESMVIQYTQGIPCLETENKEIVFKEERYTPEALTSFYEKVLAGDLEYFKITEDFAKGFYEFLNALENNLIKADFIKGQVTGPFTFAASIKDKNDKSMLSDQTMMEVVVQGLVMKASWQIKKIKDYKKNPIIFFDEPYLSAFGSAYTPLTKEVVVKTLVNLIEPLKKQDCLLGIHCCGNTDWSIFMESGFDIINFDAFNYFQNLALYTNDLKKFLKNKGTLAWGIVPTSGFEKETRESLSKRFENNIDILDKKGLDRELIFKQALITPSCGLGTLNIREAQGVFKLLSNLSEDLRKKFH
ncbi:MAG: methionine synthase [Candidatus Omnitrophota bacterium]